MLSDEDRISIQQAFADKALRVEAVDPSTGMVGLYQLQDVLRHETPHKPLVRLSLANGTDVTTTEDHSVFRKVEGSIQPVASGELKMGDKIVAVRDGITEEIEIQSVLTLPAEMHTYDLSVPGPENFVLSNGILAHNSYTIGGVSLELDKASKYEAAYKDQSEQFDKQLEKAKATVNYIMGLQQPKYGTGVRSAFGPAVGRGILSPRKFMGF